MTAISRLPAAKFRALFKQREKAMSEALKVVIGAGYGDTPPHEIRMMADDGDPAARKYVLASGQLQEARWEQKSRRDFSGTDKPIWRAA